MTKEQIEQIDKIIEVHETLNRNKILDEAIFLSICGRKLCRENSCITGVVRLEIAYHKLGLVIAKIKKQQDKKWEGSHNSKHRDYARQKP